LSREREGLEGERRAPADRTAKLAEELAVARKAVEASKKSDDRSRELLDLEQKLREAREVKDKLLREIGKLEGEMASGERRLSKMAGERDKASERMIALTE